MVTYERLRQLLTYNPTSGEFVWNESRGCRPAGSVAGRLGERGYWQIRIDRRLYQAHRLAWMYMTGQWPPDEIDHKDGAEANNVWANLRTATRSENMTNRRFITPSMCGAYFCKDKGKWKSSIKVSGRTIHLGYFQKPQEAHTAYLKARREHLPFQPAPRI